VACSLIWILALAVRLIFLWQISGTDVFSLVMGDGIRYDAWAQEIARGEWLGHRVFYQAPLYPYFLGLVYTVVGRNFLILRLLQAVIGATSCVLLAQAGSRFFSRKAGLIAGVLLALYPTAIFLDYAIQKSVLDLFFICGLLAVLGLIKEHPDARWWVAAGAVLGLLALTRENALVFLPIILIWLFIAWRGEWWSKRLRWAGWFLLGVNTVLLPVAFRNQLVGGEFHLTTAQFGPNFYIGNSRYANGIYRPLIWNHESAKYEQDDAIMLAEQALKRKLTAGEVSGYWTTRTLADIRERPLHWLSLLGRKWMLLWNVSEISDTDDQYTYGEWSVLLRVLNRVLNFGTIFPLAVFGVCVMWSQGRRPWLLYAMFLGYAVSVVMFYIFARYRFPLIPLLLLFVSGGLVSLRNALRDEHSHTTVISSGLALAFAFICNQPMAKETDARGATHYNIAADLAAQHGDLDGALRHCTEAVRLRPNLPPAHHMLAMLLSKKGRTQEAIDEERETLRLYPDYADAHNHLAVLLAQQDNLDEAISHAQSALKLNPFSDTFRATLEELERTRTPAK
jgi:tetratricopeptide (TPR) repeat protein